MIRENLPKLKEEMGNMNNFCGNTIHFIDEIIVAENTIDDLSAQQKSTVIAKFNAKATEFLGLVDRIKTVFTATQPIP